MKTSVEKSRNQGSVLTKSLGYTLSLFIFVTLPINVHADHINPPPDDLKSIGGSHFISELESNLSMLVLAFGIITIFSEVYLIKTNKIDSNNAIKFIIVTLIITGALFLITAGYDTQISPVLGLLGTIAGYLLGKTEHNNSKSNES